MRMLLLVAVGGAIGAGTRHLIASWFMANGWHGFPWATFVINVTGSMLMGVLIGVLAVKTAPSPELRAFFATGILGGYTTFSAFSLDAWLLMERNEMTAAALYVGGSVLLSILALVAGLHAVKLVAS